MTVKEMKRIFTYVVRTDGVIPLSRYRQRAKLNRQGDGSVP